MSKESVGNGFAGNIDAVDDEDDLAAGQFRSRDHGAIEIAKVSLGRAPAERKGNVDMDLILRDRLDGEGLAQFPELSEGGDGEVDLLDARALMLQNPEK